MLPGSSDLGGAFDPGQHRILIVDDTPVNLEILSRMLESRGFGVLVASDGSEAIAAAEAEGPDLILLDIMMPEMDGFEVCRRLKALPEVASIPIVFMSALTETSKKLTGFEAGAVDYITKPFDRAEVIARILIHLELREARRRLEDDNVRVRGDLVREKLHQQERAREFGSLTIYAILITSYSGHVAYSKDAGPTVVLLSSWGILLLSVLPVAALVRWWMRQPPSDYGLQFVRVRRNLTEALVLVAVLLPAMAAFEAIREPGEALFTWRYFQGWPTHLVILYFALYPLHSFLQEFVMRGVMQGSMARFLNTAPAAVPILVTSFLFAQAHGQVSIELGIVTFLMSAFLGSLYHRHESLLGVTIVHAALGVMAQALGYL